MAGEVWVRGVPVRAVARGLPGVSAARLEEALRAAWAEAGSGPGLVAAFDESVGALGLEASDATVVAACRSVARAIDVAVDEGNAKALYLLPHLLNGLRELGATPAARASMAAASRVAESRAAAAARAADAAAEEGAHRDDLRAFKARRDGGSSA